MSMAPFASVLIVEDSRAQAMLGEAVCRELGMERVYHAGNGQEGLDIIHALDPAPDLILLDLEMPVMDGVEVLQYLAKESLAIPVVVTSGKDLRLLGTVEIMGRELGLPLLGVLSKPVSAGTLGDLLARRHRADRIDLLSADDVRAALDEGRVMAWFQPKVDLQTGQTKGCEVLARLRSRNGEVIPPDRFVPVMEAQGWGTELTLLMLDLALAEWNRWSAAGKELMLSVNLSPRSLSGTHLVKEIEGKVRRAGVPPSAILFEITETAVADNLAEALAITARLRLAGFGLSIDDFGTGFATVQQLRRFPFTELKVDKSLVTSLAEKPHLAAIVDGVVQLARQLSLTSVAEGVETEADLLALRETGCQIGQGYWFARPMSGDALLDWLSA